MVCVLTDLWWNRFFLCVCRVVGWRRLCTLWCAVSVRLMTLFEVAVGSVMALVTAAVRDSGDISGCRSDVSGVVGADETSAADNVLVDGVREVSLVMTGMVLACAS